MKLSLNNFLFGIKQIIMGNTEVDGGFLKRAEAVCLATLKMNAVMPATSAITGTVFTTFDIGAGAADSTLVVADTAFTTVDIGAGVADKTLVVADTPFTTVDIGATADKTLVAVTGSWDATAIATINNNFEDVGTCINTIISNTNQNLEDIGTCINTVIASTNQNFEDAGTKINALVADVTALKTSVDAIQAALKLTVDETNARVLKVEETIDNIGHIIYTVPRDYDEAVDVLTLRVLASMVSVSTDDDVQLDAEVYIKKAGVALTADQNPTKPATILSTTEQWLEFDLSGYGLNRDDVIIIELLTDGHNDTNGEEVLIHDLELVYRSTIVSYEETDSSGNDLR